MPELPDVEAFKKYFDETSLNKKIVETDLSDRKMLKNSSPSEFNKITEGHKFTLSLRHGKYFFARLDNKKYVMIHFGMTGYLLYYKLPEEASPTIRLQFKFQNGFYLAVDNRRRFGQIMLVDDFDDFIKAKNLGPDPVNSNLTYKEFEKLSDKKSGTIKALLMDQSFIAGIGNLYSDEIAFQAGVHPSASFNSLSQEKKKDLYKNMISILKTAVKKDGEHSALPAKFLLRHRKDGEECPVCGGEITHKTIAGRTSYFCVSHQKK